MSRTFVADGELSGERLDRAVSLRLGMSRGQAQQRLAGGRVRVDGSIAAKSHRLHEGQVVVVDDAPAPPPVEPPPTVPVRYDDDHLAIVAKPAGLVVHAGAGTTGPTLVDALRAMGMPLAAGDDPARPGIVHRLDRGTSGLLVVAKTQRARTALVGLFKRHAVDRRYWALVDGRPDPPSATIEAPIARDPGRRTRFRVDPAGRAAVSHYDVEQAFRGVSHITVRLETGRTHQVRVHMAAVGHPVSGDVTYGADPTLAENVGLTRPALHAHRITFAHPISDVEIEIHEPLPDDLRLASDALADPSAD